MPKSHLKKSRSKSKLFWIIVSLAFFLAGSIYLAIASGTGPFSFLTNTALINPVTTRTERDDVVAGPNAGKSNNTKYTYNVSTERDKDTGDTIKTTSITTTNNGTTTTNKIVNGKNKPNESKDQNSAEDVPAAQSTIVPPPITSCVGGNGVKLTPGKYAATGYGWKDGKRSTESGTSQRECVYINDNCDHSTVVACDEQYLKDPSSVILPVSAGTEYYAGKTPAQIKEAEKNKIPLPSKPQENCYDKSGTIHVTGDTNGENRCFNGSFLPEIEFDKKMGATCDQSIQEYNAGSNKCEAKANPFTLVPLPPIDHVKAKQQCEAANNKDTNKANDNVYTQHGTYGICSPVRAPSPTCKAGVSSDGKSFTECSDNKSIIKFCNTDLGFDKDGNCQLTPTNFGAPANPATINSPIRQVSSKSDCGSGETYTSKSIGGNFAYFCSTNDGTNNNKPIVIPQNSPIRQVNSKNDCRLDENYTSFSTSGKFISVCVEDQTKQNTETSDSDANLNPPAVNPRTGQPIDNTSDDSSGFWNWIKGVFAPATFNPRTGQGTGNEASEPLGNTENTETSDSDANLNPPAVNPRTGQPLDSSTNTTNLWETIKSWFTSSTTFNPRTGQGVEEGDLPAGTRCYIVGDENLCSNCVNHEFHDKDNNPLNGNELICGK